MNKKNYKHGMSRDKFYKAWVNMRRRCQQKNKKQFNNWGGRGIKVCKEWLLFINFKHDMYDSHLEHIKLYGVKNTTLDRIDNDGNYCKENCRWATYKEQVHNRRTVGSKPKNILYTLNGVTMTLYEWSIKYNMSYKILYKRMFEHGWEIERALTQPIGTKIRMSGMSYKSYLNITFKNETMSITNWSKKLKIPKSTLRKRLLKLGWSIEEALSNKH